VLGPDPTLPYTGRALGRGRCCGREKEVRGRMVRVTERVFRRSEREELRERDSIRNETLTILHIAWATILGGKAL